MLKIKSLGLVLIISVSSFFLPQRGLAEEVYRFSMMPQFFPERINMMTAPLVKYLAAGLGKHITSPGSKNNADYVSLVNGGAVEMGYQNPVVYNEVSGTHEVIAVGISPEGGDRYRGLIIVPSSSHITGLSELKGKTVMIVGKNTGGGYVSPRITLLEKGIDTEKDLKIISAADNKQENVLIAVSIGDADAGFIRESALHSADAFIKPGSVQILAYCAWLPGWAFSVKRSLPAYEKAKIKDLLVNIPPDSPILKSLGLKGFRAADDSLYEPMRRLDAKSQAKSDEKQQVTISNKPESAIPSSSK